MNMRYLRYIFAAWAALCGAGVGAAHGRVLYAAPGGTNDTPPFFPEARATSNLNLAVQHALDGDLVLALNGHYVLKETLFITNGIILTGETSSTIEGSLDDTLLFVTDLDAVVRGLTLTKSSGSGGGIVYMTGGLIEHCELYNGRSASGGGGAYVDGAGALRRCHFGFNSSTTNGGALYLRGGTAEDCSFYGNTADGQGGAIYMASTATRLKNCVVWGNYGAYGGGLCAAGGLVENCTILSNSASYGGGLMALNGAIIRNTIVYHNEAFMSDPEWLDDENAFVLEYSCTRPLPGDARDGGGNITNAPETFIFSPPRRVILQPSSPCINAGTNQPWMLQPRQRDFGMKRRVLDGTVDIGAAEFAATNTPPALFMDPDTVEFLAERTLTQFESVRAWNGGGGSLAAGFVSSNSWIPLVIPSATTLTGDETTNLTIYFNVAGQPPGRHTGVVQGVYYDGASLTTETVTVYMQVPGAAGILAVSPEQTNATLPAGNVRPYNVQVRNEGADFFNYELRSDSTWLLPAPLFGSTGTEPPGGQHSLVVNTIDMIPGIYTGIVAVTATGVTNSPLSITMILTVTSTSPAAMHVSPTNYAIRLQQGTASPAHRLSVSNSGGSAFSFSVMLSETWVQVTPRNGDLAPGQQTELSVIFDAGTLAAGPYYTDIVVYGGLGVLNSPARIPVDLVVTSAPSPTYGWLSARLQPSAAASLGRWKASTMTDWKESGSSVRLPVGTYSVEFEPVAGWQTPSPLHGVEVFNGATTNVTGRYLHTNDMVTIPSNTFLMYVREGQGGIPVTINEYRIDRKEVTVGEFLDFCTANDTLMPPQPWGSANPDLPVVNVTWAQADAYARWMGKHLPSEAQWECAARGGLADHLYPWGNTISPSFANYHLYVGQPTVAGSYPANNFGLWDTAGNVWEWCGDWYQSPPPEASGGFAPTGTLKIIRGGSYISSDLTLQNGVRYGYDPAAARADLGFRCARGWFVEDDSTLPATRAGPTRGAAGGTNSFSAPLLLLLLDDPAP